MKRLIEENVLPTDFNLSAVFIEERHGNTLAGNIINGGRKFELAALSTVAASDDWKKIIPGSILYLCLEKNTISSITNVFIPEEDDFIKAIDPNNSENIRAGFIASAIELTNFDIVQVEATRNSFDDDRTEFFIYVTGWSERDNCNYLIPIQGHANLKIDMERLSSALLMHFTEIELSDELPETDSKGFELITSTICGNQGQLRFPLAAYESVFVACCDTSIFDECALLKTTTARITDSSADPVKLFVLATALAPEEKRPVPYSGKNTRFAVCEPDILPFMVINGEPVFIKAELMSPERVAKNFSNRAEPTVYGPRKPANDHIIRYDI